MSSKAAQCKHLETMWSKAHIAIKKKEKHNKTKTDQWDFKRDKASLRNVKKLSKAEVLPIIMD